MTEVLVNNSLPGHKTGRLFQQKDADMVAQKSWHGGREEYCARFFWGCWDAFCGVQIWLTWADIGSRRNTIRGQKVSISTSRGSNIMVFEKGRDDREMIRREHRDWCVSVRKDCFCTIRSHAGRQKEGNMLKTRLQRWRTSSWRLDYSTCRALQAIGDIGAFTYGEERRVTSIPACRDAPRGETNHGYFEFKSL
jgi:hypothetical protein